MKGLHVSVLKDASSNYDCTAGGVSSNHSSFILVGENHEDLRAPFEVKDGEVYLKLVRRFLFGRDYFHVEPYLAGRPLKETLERNSDRLIGPMAGGNFVWSCDSRFPCDYPLAIHDRYETQEVYDALSR